MINLKSKKTIVAGVVVLGLAIGAITMNTANDNQSQSPDARLTAPATSDQKTENTVTSTPNTQNQVPQKTLNSQPSEQSQAAEPSATQPTPAPTTPATYYDKGGNPSVNSGGTHLQAVHNPDSN
jgi:cytoskeletal protein RodZ